MSKLDCIFCKIAGGSEPCHKIWEDKKHIAFLSIHPNTLGTTVIIPKKHFSSYAFDMPSKDLAEFMIANKKVAKILDGYFPGVGRTALVLEGFGVDHVHAKLFPLHGTNLKNWRPILSGSSVNKYFTKYEGYVSSHSADRASDSELAILAQKIREQQKNQ